MLNLKLNYPSVPVEADIFQNYCQTLSPENKWDLLHPPYRTLNDEALQTVRQWLMVPEGAWKVAPLPSANNGVYCILTWFRGKTPAIACEPYTFPGFRMAAGALGFELRPIESDADGILPEALRQRLQAGDCKLVYLQPTVHNPTTSVMPLARREAIVAVMREFDDVYIIEDDAYRFLHPDPPPSFLQLAPEKTLHVYSLSKAFNPMVKSAYLVHPENTLQGIENIVHLSTSGTSRLFINFGLHLMNGPLLKSVMHEKQRIGLQWREKCEQTFSGLDFQMFPGSLHCWLHVPLPAELCKQLNAQGIDVPDGAEFTVTGSNQYVRIALGAVWDNPELANSLATIAALVRKQ